MSQQIKNPPAPPPDEDELLEADGASMSFWEHLDELRSRLVKAALALVVGTVVGFFLARPVLEFLLSPNIVDQLVVLGPTGSVVNYFRVALLVGGILSIPMVTYQLLMFILPGLLPNEKRILLGSLPAITLLFLVGVGFAWFVLVPPALGFLRDFQSDVFRPEWTADLYLGFITALLFWMGVAFETPLVFFVLSILGFVTAGALVRNWRIAIIGAAVAAAMITPTIDPVNMGLVMGPLLALYAISILLVFIGSRIYARRLDAS